MRDQVRLSSLSICIAISHQSSITSPFSGVYIHSYSNLLLEGKMNQPKGKCNFILLSMLCFKLRKFHSYHIIYHGLYL